MGTRFDIFCWTLCSGHLWDVSSIRVWGNSGRQWVGCVGRYIIVIVFGIFVLIFERVRARLYFYGVICLTTRSHFTYISGLGSHDSKDSLAGRTFLHMFPWPWPRTWTACTAKSTLTKRNAVCPAAALSASAIPGISVAELMARTSRSQPHEYIPHTSPTPRMGTYSPLLLLSPLADEIYVTAQATGLVAASRTVCPVQSRQSSPLMICVRVSIDERRYQVVCTPCRR